MTRSPQATGRCLLVKLVLCTQLAVTSAATQQPDAVPTERFEATGVSCYDGDTCTVQTTAGKRYRIRVFGVDAPELTQDFGREARSFSTGLIVGSRLTVFPANLERNDRLVARVRVPRGDDLSTLLLRSGHAWHSTEFSKDPLLADAERTAREGKRGLWARPDPVPPWIFRRNSRRSGGTSPSLTTPGPFHGNVNSRIFHAKACKDFECKNCTRVFATAGDAVQDGFRPHTACVR
jgi:endonuclease YncB( thermonuclease family)